jgi:hypothetical protein
MTSEGERVMRQLSRHVFVDDAKPGFVIKGPKGQVTEMELFHDHSDHVYEESAAKVGLDLLTFTGAVEQGLEYLDEVLPEP